MVYRICFLACAVLLALPALSQVTELEEKKPELLNGFEYGWYIRNEQQKNVKDEEYSRFEITFYVTNKTGCTKLYADRNSLLSADAANLLATFSCFNANGKRFTSKGGSVKARDFYVNTKVQENGKEIYRSGKAGYIFRNGETLTNNIIVLIPKGERPKIQCTVNSLNEL